MNALTRRSVMAGLALALASPALAQSPQPVPMTILIYEAGPSWKAGKPINEQGLEPHLGYVGEAFKANAVVAYGPEDNSSLMRGYYILKGADPAKADAFVAADPGIKAGVLKRAGSHVWQAVVNGFRSKQDGGRYAILRMEPGPKWVAGKPITEQNIAAHFGYMIENAKSGLVVAAGPDGSGQQGWYILNGDKSAVDKLLANDPGVVSGLLKPVVVGWNVIDMRPTP